MQTLKEFLPNGARVLACKPSERHEGGFVVMCEWGNDYVTWLVDKDGNAVQGRYFPGKGIEAAEDYKGRE